MKLSGKQINEFRKTILDFYAVSGRSFPWRGNPGNCAGNYPGGGNHPGSGKKPEQNDCFMVSPWGVLVSEFMLQQTQTGRVIPYWERWMKKWPTPSGLAAAPLEEVLREWSGLGYNRRAKNLWNCAAALTENCGGKVPCTPEELAALPGIGPYTAGAVACFAFNYPAVFIETNIRSVMLHFFFADKTGIKDEELVLLLEQTLDASNPRVWYWALMDYGAELKKLTGNPGRKSARYTKQSRFEGSFRQIRGALVRTLSRGPQNASILKRELDKTLPDMAEGDYYRALEILEKELFVAEEKGVYRIR